MFNLFETDLNVDFTILEAYPVGGFESPSFLSPTIHVNYHVFDFKGKLFFFAFTPIMLVWPSLIPPFL